MMNCADVAIPAARRLFGRYQPVLMLVTYANPGADWLVDRLSAVARDAGCPAVGVNHVFPFDSGKTGGRSRIVSADGNELWSAPMGKELLETWVFQVPHRHSLPPRVDAGRARTIRLPENTVELEGYAVAAPSPAKTVWEKLSGLGQVSFANRHAPTTRASFSEAGVYRISLTANDGVNTAHDVVSVTVLPGGERDPNLAGHWTFDLTPDDRSGNCNHASFKGNPSYARDGAPIRAQNTASLDLDGRGNYLEIPHSISLNAPHAATVSLWFKSSSRPSGGDGRVLLGKGSGYLDMKFNYMLLQTADYFLTAQGMDGQRAVTIGDSTQSIDNWLHVAAVYDADKGQIRLYFNGVLDSTVIGVAGRNTVNAHPLLIGTRGKKAETFHGLIDDVRVYSRALSDEEIASLVAGATINEPPTVDAGPDIDVKAGREVILHASFQDDARGSASISQWHRWTQIAGPTGVVIDNPYSPATSAVFLSPGVYLLELQGSDGGNLAYDTLIVTAR